MRSRQLDRQRRLVKDADYGRVHGKGKSWAHPLLVLRILPNGSEITRFGFSVGKRIGKAVVRNRVKRLLKEITRSVSVRLGWDVVFIARAPAAQASYVELKAAAVEVLRRARLLTEVPPKEER